MQGSKEQTMLFLRKQKRQEKQQLLLDQPMAVIGLTSQPLLVSRSKNPANLSPVSSVPCMQSNEQACAPTALTDMRCLGKLPALHMLRA